MKNKINSICFIGQGLEGGGIERTLSSLANYYFELGVKVSIILLFKTDSFYYINPDIKVHYPNISRDNCNKYTYAIKLLPYLRNTIIHIKPDVVLSFNEWYNPYVLLVTQGLKIPVFVSDRMSPNIKLDYFNKILKIIIYKKAAGVISQTKYAAEILKRNVNPKQIIVIPNPLNVINDNNKIKYKSIVSLGRLSKEKGHKYLIEAFSLITASEWELHIIGDGPERVFLEEMSRKLCPDKIVVFHGHLKEFSQIMCKAQIFVLPSLSEGYPNALIEAMSVPLACISTNCVSGPSDIIQNGYNGILVNVGDCYDLADKINMLINDKDLRTKISVNAYKIRDTLNFTDIALKYLQYMNNSII